MLSFDQEKLMIFLFRGIQIFSVGIDVERIFHFVRFLGCELCL